MPETTPPFTDYRDTQARRDAEYRAAWNALDDATLARLADAGLSGPDCDDEPARNVGIEGDIAAISDRHSENATYADMSAILDRSVDEIRERFNLSQRQAEGIDAWHRAAMKAGVQVEVARMLFRIIGFLLQPGSPRALQMRAYALAYASRMGEYSQLFSLRDTARKCAVSVEALRKCAWYWVEQLGLPPLEGAKSQAAKTKYAANGLDNHWRHQKCKNPTTTPSK